MSLVARTRRVRLLSRMGIRRLLVRLTPAVVSTLVACGEQDSSERTQGPSLATSGKSELAGEVRRLTAGRGIIPLNRPSHVRPGLVNLGQALAFEILSGVQGRILHVS